MLYSKQGVKCGYGVLQFNAVVESNIHARHLYERLGFVQLGTIPSISDYDTIILGYPCWWGTMPQAVFTFLESADFSGKKILPFCTHEGSGMGRSETDIKKLCPTATVAKGLAINGSSCNSAESSVKKWLIANGIL